MLFVCFLYNTLPEIDGEFSGIFKITAFLSMLYSPFKREFPWEIGVDKKL